MLAARQRVQRLRAAPAAGRPSARAARPARCGGSARRRRETRPQQLLGLAHPAGADEVEHAGIEGPFPIGVLGGTARRRALPPGPRTSRSSRVSYSGPSSVCVTASFSHAASAGLRPPVPIGDHDVALPDDRHERERAVVGVVGRVDPDPAASPASNTARFTAGSSVAVGRQPGAVEVARARTRARRPSPGRRRATPATSSPSLGATTCTSAPAASSASILRAAIRPPPTTTQRRPRTSRFTG